MHETYTQTHKCQVYLKRVEKCSRAICLAASVVEEERRRRGGCQQTWKSCVLNNNEKNSLANKLNEKHLNKIYIMYTRCVRAAFYQLAAW